MKQSEFSTPGYTGACTKLKSRQTEAQVRSKLCEQKHANIRDFEYGKNSFKKFCNEVTSPQAPVKFKTGFTLAEVLLTLAVIGIVAAITLPSLLVDTTEKAFDAQKRALHARLAQAIGMMSSLSGYGQYVEEVKNEDGSTKTEGKDDAAETFLYEGLSKVYKMNNICDSDNLDKCGIPTSITTMAGETLDFPKNLSELSSKLDFGNVQKANPKPAAFETVNGESVAVFYNPSCKSYILESANTSYGIDKVCVNFVYDLNGTKGPNKVGRDIGFITALYAKNSEVVAPIPFESDLEGGKAYNYSEAVEACAKYADDSRLPNIHELTAIFYNANLIGSDTFTPTEYWSGSLVSSTNGWIQFFAKSAAAPRHPYGRVGKFSVRCVRK